MPARRPAAGPEATTSDGTLALRSDRHERLGRWQLVERLGAGGTAVVWRATDAAGNEAALKVLHERSDEYLRREHDALERFRHRNVVRTLGVVDDPRAAALALEYLPGGDLVTLLGGDPRHWLRALRDVLTVVRHMHAQGFAHCDVKARNVLFAADGGTRLVDFASARPLDAALRRGVATAATTPAGPVTSGRTADCFAFAVLLYEATVGRLPYGVGGIRWQGEPPPAAAAADPATAPLLAAATDALLAGGDLDEGLSLFADVIESALEACR
jgi:serine/threonine protein kinase